jgi:imidazole glycerol-phosphate synthase subunit HisF
MFRPRIIPVLLLKEQALVKSKRFKDHRYIGDPINAVRIFNDLRADELVFLDIDATRENRLVSLSLVKDIGEESNMPFAVGGGIRSIRDIQSIIGAGAEKVILGSYAAERPAFVKEAVDTFGASTIAVCIDVKKGLLGGSKVYTRNGSQATPYSPEEFAMLMEEQGAGELILQSIDRDGEMKGYDVPLIRKVAQSVRMPLVCLGGAGSIADLKEAYVQGQANGLAAGSFFVFRGPKHGVLISYPEKSEMIL